MLFETFSVGLASLMDRGVMAPRKREHLPEIVFHTPPPVLHIGTLDTCLNRLRDQAWSSFRPIEQEALLNIGRGHLG